MKRFDCIVVGSGATGSIAAQALLAQGFSVLMLDAGQRDLDFQSLIPERSFMDLRQSDPEQYKYFLGPNLETLGPQPGEGYAHLTPPRRALFKEVQRFLRNRSETFSAVESLAFGGLGSGWGLGCNVFSDSELQQASLPISEMRDAYQAIADLIGISGSADDASAYTHGGLSGVQPSVPLNPTAAAILQSYKRQRSRFQKQGFQLGRPALALLTEAKDGRSPTTLRDMDFYSDAERAAWRPWILVDQLKRSPGFSYIGNSLVTRFTERDGVIQVHALNMQTLENDSYTCARLILAVGAIGSARIVLRSQDDLTTQLPLLCNPYTYMPCIVPARIGKPVPDRDMGLAQLVLFHDRDNSHTDIAQASLYTYRSLLLFRLMSEMPLGIRDARIILQALTPALVIAGIHHPQQQSTLTYLVRELDATAPTGDRIAISSAESEKDYNNREHRERCFIRALRSMGAWTIKRVHPRRGASIHYAGTLPYSTQEKDYSLNPDGRLHKHKNVFVADGSGFTFLPAKGLTLSLMANAHRVAKAVGLTMRS